MLPNKVDVEGDGPIPERLDDLDERIRALRGEVFPHRVIAVAGRLRALQWNYRLTSPVGRPALDWEAQLDALDEELRELEQWANIDVDEDAADSGGEQA